MAISKVPHGYINTKNLSDGFMQSAHQTFGVGRAYSRGKIATRTVLDTATMSPKPGMVHDYTFTHTEINPYRTGALLAGGAAAGYGAYRGAKWVKNNPDKVKSGFSNARTNVRGANRAIGTFYAKHPQGTGNAAAVGITAPWLIPWAPLPAVLGTSAGVMGAHMYGARQAEKVSGKSWNRLMTDSKKARRAKKQRLIQ